MITTYAMSLSTKKWTEDTRQSCAHLVQSWLQRQFSADRMPANVRVRVRQSPEDEVFRAEISESFKQSGSIRTTTITVAPHRGQLVFDVRVRQLPGKDSIVPRRLAEAPPNPVLQLGVDIARLLEVYDAERRVAPTVRSISTPDDGQALGADSLDALSRRLPIIVEYTGEKTVESSLTGTLAHDLIGVAHIVHITTKDALRAFNDYCASTMVSEQYVTVIWPIPVPATIITTSQPKREQIAAMIFDAAATQPELPIQAPPRGALVRQPSITPVAEPRPANDTASLKQTIDLLQQQMLEHRFHIDQLDELLAESDEQNDALVDDLEEFESENDTLKADNVRLRENLDVITLHNLDLEAERDRKAPGAILRTVLDAVYKARKECTNLVFLKSALETADLLQGPNPERVLNDLRKLDKVVQAWRANAFSFAGLGSYMRDEYNLDYAANISEYTAHRYASYYTVTYEGRQVLLGAHLRRGKNQSLIRIYMHIDTAKKQIVIGKVDRHGPDRTS
jgi:regulator of replication initiation timing